MRPVVLLTLLELVVTLAADTTREAFTLNENFRR